MDDQRIEARPALGFEDLDHRGRVVGARAQPIDRLGRQMDQVPGAQGGDGGRDVRGHFAAFAFTVIATLTTAGMASVLA